MLWRLWLLVWSDRQTDRGTMSPIELLWTAKNTCPGKSLTIPFQEWDMSHEFFHLNLYLSSWSTQSWFFWRRLPSHWRWWWRWCWWLRWCWWWRWYWWWRWPPWLQGRAPPSWSTVLHCNTRSPWFGSINSCLDIYKVRFEFDFLGSS